MDATVTRHRQLQGETATFGTWAAKHPSGQLTLLGGGKRPAEDVKPLMAKIHTPGELIDALAPSVARFLQ